MEKKVFEVSLAGTCISRGTVGRDEDCTFVTAKTGMIMCIESGNLYDKDPEIKNEIVVGKGDVIKIRSIASRYDRDNF